MFVAHVQERVKTHKQAEKQHEQPLLNPPKREYKYHPRLIERALNYEVASGRIVANPYHMNADDVRLIDSDWLRDRARYLEEEQFWKDAEKRTAAGLT